MIATPSALKDSSQERRPLTAALTAAIPFIAAVIVPFLIFVAHAMLFRDWIIDDAGISFAYARNLASGNGLVSQPGSAPVEGYSNFTWVALLSPFFVAGLFQPVIVPKLISLALIFTSFFTAWKTLRMMTPRSGLACGAALVFLSINTSFVVWTTSGLENPLLLLLLAQLFYWMIRYNHAGLPTRIPYALGFLTALIAMTRPDGIIFFFAFPVMLFIRMAFRPSGVKKELKGLFDFWAFFSWPFILFLLVRKFYFDDMLPNTFYAKQSANAAYLGVSNLGSLINSTLPFLGYPVLALLILATIYLAVRKRLGDDMISLLSLLFCSLATFSLLEADWMPEFRFATGFIFFLYIFAFTVLAKSLDSLTENRDITAPALAAVFVVFAGIIILPGTPSFISRSRDFSRNPTIPFAIVGESVAPWFNRAAAQLEIRDPSLLSPDIGGQLYYSNLRIHDLGGLCDKTIARTWGRNDQAALDDYVYETLEPSFILTHPNWGGARIDSDYRLQRDYSKISMKDGSTIYVRNSLTAGRQDQLRELRSSDWN